MAYHLPGPCSITFDTYSLGTTKAGVIIRPKATWNPIIVDQYGASPIGYVYAGQSAIVEMVLVEAGNSRGFGRLRKDMFPGGLLGCLSGAGDLCLIGETALTAKGYGGGGNGICGELTIAERDYSWVAGAAFPLDPAEFLLTSTNEKNVPVTFIIIPSGSPPKLFSTLPYL